MSPAGGEFSPKYFAKRCWDIAFIGLISSITVLSINPFSFIGNWLLINFKDKPFLGFSIIILLLSLVLTFAKKAGFFYRRFFVLNCPHPITGVVVSFVICLCFKGIPEFLTSLYLFLIIVASAIITYLNSFFSSDTAEEITIENTAKSGLNILTADGPAYESWLQKEEPIDSYETDFFGASLYASRIQNHIIVKRKGFIGIVGSKGIGKSSVIALLNKKLKQIPETITLTASLWGCNSTNIGKFILEKMVTAIEQEIFCLEFKNLPENFSKFVNPAVGNSISLIQELFSFKKDTLQEIAELDNMLQLFSVKLIVCIEDVDRLNPESTIPRDLAFLMDSLQGSKNIVFIVSLVHSTQNAQIMARVLDYLEWMPHLRVDHNVTAIIEKTIFRLLDDKKYSVLTHKNNNIRARLGLKKAGELEITRYLDWTLHNKITNSVINSIVSLIKTPRNLKSLLREIDRIWQSLNGEIDFCDMLVTCAIRNFQPAVFFLLIDRIDQFRLLAEPAKDNHDAQEKLRKELSEMIRASIPTTEYREVEYLVDFLFPGFSKPKNSACGFTFQRFILETPTDYFKRFVVGELNEDEISDQSLLRLIADISNENQEARTSTDELIRLISEKSAVAEKLEDFKDFFSDQPFYKFCSDYFRHALKNCINEDFRDYAGFTELWRISFSKKLQNRQEWLLEELEKAIQISLGAANDLYYFWRLENQHSLSRKITTKELRKGFLESGKKHLNEKNLCRVLSINQPFAIWHFAYLYSDTSFGEDGFKPEDWAWLGIYLIKAAKEQPETILPQISIFLAQRTNVFPEATYSFTDERKAMFGNSYQELLAMFKTFVIPEALNQEAECYLRTVIDHVKTTN